MNPFKHALSVLHLAMILAVGYAFFLMAGPDTESLDLGPIAGKATGMSGPVKSHVFYDPDTILAASEWIKCNDQESWFRLP
jgi:hypothetical protein